MTEARKRYFSGGTTPANLRVAFPDYDRNASESKRYPR